MAKDSWSDDRIFVAESALILFAVEFGLLITWHLIETNLFLLFINFNGTF